MWKNAESWCLNEKGKWSATGWNIGTEMFTGDVPIWLEWTWIDNYGWDLGHPFAPNCTTKGSLLSMGLLLLSSYSHLC